MRILVVEDEPKVLEFIKKGLNSSEFTVDTAESLDEVFANMLSLDYDVIVLDRMLRGQDSISYLKKIKNKAPNTKILVLSALSDVDDKVDGLDSGADDYLGKPFHLSELIARLRALMRREDKTTSTKNTILYKDLAVNFDSQRVERSGQKIELTPKEYKLLLLLIKKPNKIYSKMEIINHVWEMQFFPQSNVVEVVINHLRTKINKGFEAPLIHSKRNVGYWLGDTSV